MILHLHQTNQPTIKTRNLPNHTMTSSTTSTLDNVRNLTKKKVALSSPVARMGALAVIGGVAIVGYNMSSMKPSNGTAKEKSTESQYGTADGNFPSATPDASLSKLPGNKDHLDKDQHQSGSKKH